ncbi:NUDIX hydrolase domain-like protein [Xylariaceae sp. FL1651]|nr:NUDIX hydrolase domain-like protein [Xylariaceae sp. FL1651]
MARTNTYGRSSIAVGKKRRPRRNVKYDAQATSKIVGEFQKLSTRAIWSRDHPDHAVDWKDDKVWEKIRKEGCYHKSDEIIVSCGTVTINQAESRWPEVLVVYNKNIGIYQLPKGRKDFGEGYLDAAIRETSEETGIAVRPLRLRFGSRSTLPRLAHPKGAKICGTEDLSTGITKGLNPDPATGAWRNIHWYAAKPRDDIRRDESRMPLPGDREKFSTFWFPEAEALSMLKLDDEKFMVRVAFEYTRNMSTDDWSGNRELEKKEDHTAGLV